MRPGTVLDLSDLRKKVDPEKITEDDVYRACRILLNDVASDLGVDSADDDAFQDLAGDRMSDAGVPEDMIDRVLARLKKNP